MIADAVVASAMHAQTSPQSLLSPPAQIKTSNASRQKSKSKESKKTVQDESALTVNDALDASCALERELLLKLCDLLEMKFDMVRLIEVDAHSTFDWHTVHRNHLPAPTSPTSEIRSKAWGLQVCEPVVRGLVVMNDAFSHASCVVRWVRGKGIVVESMPTPAGGTTQPLTEGTDPVLSPQCIAWTKKQVALEKGIDSSLARAHVALGPMRANATI